MTDQIVASSVENITDQINNTVEDLEDPVDKTVGNVHDSLVGSVENLDGKPHSSHAELNDQLRSSVGNRDCQLLSSVGSLDSQFQCYLESIMNAPVQFTDDPSQSQEDLRYKAESMRKLDKRLNKKHSDQSDLTRSRINRFNTSFCKQSRLSLQQGSAARLGPYSSLWHLATNNTVNTSRSAHEIGIPIQREDSQETIEIPVQINMDRSKSYHDFSHCGGGDLEDNDPPPVSLDIWSSSTEDNSNQRPRAKSEDHKTSRLEEGVEEVEFSMSSTPSDNTSLKEETEALMEYDSQKNVNWTELIFAEEIKDFSIEMKMPLTKETTTKQANYLKSYYSVVHLFKLLGARDGDGHNSKVNKTMLLLKSWSKDQREGTWTLNIKDKKISGDLICEAVSNIIHGNISQGVNLAQEAKKRAIKEFQSRDNNMDRIMFTRIILFATALDLSMDKSEESIVPLHQLKESSRNELVTEIQNVLQKLQISLTRKKSDSTRRKGSKKESLERKSDQFYKDVYPILSEVSQFHFSFQLIQPTIRMEIKIGTGNLPAKEENAVVLPIGCFIADSVFQYEEERLAKEFQIVYLFCWRKVNSLYLRTDSTLYEIQHIHLKDPTLVLSLGFTDNFNLSNLLLVKSEQYVDGKEIVPDCIARNIMEEATGGKMDVSIYQEISKLGLFYLKSVFGFRIDQVDEERRTLLHYASWIGLENVVEILLSLDPDQILCQDEYGETPVMLAVKGGKDCLPSLRLLLDEYTGYFLNTTKNYDGLTALHISAIGVDPIMAEVLIRAGASPNIKDMIGRSAVDLVDSNNISRKQMIALLKKYSR